jgi:hypothetical protein
MNGDCRLQIQGLTIEDRRLGLATGDLDRRLDWRLAIGMTIGDANPPIRIVNANRQSALANP